MLNNFVQENSMKIKLKFLANSGELFDNSEVTQ
jgi:hypothetical protein